MAAPMDVKAKYDMDFEVFQATTQVDTCSNYNLQDIQRNCVELDPTGCEIDVSPDRLFTEYKVLSGDLNLLTQITNNGLLSVNVDRDVTKTVDLLILLEHEELSCFRRVIIFVQETDNHAPVFVVPLFVFSVKEDAENGDIIGKLRATDEDEGDVIEYTLLSTDNPFSVDPVTGNLSLQGVLNFEEIRIYDLDVQVSSDGKSFSTAQVHIIVEDVDDERPVFRSNSNSFQFDVFVDTVGVIGVIPAVDKDTYPHNLIYTLALSSSPILNQALSVSQGVISVTSPLGRLTDQALGPYYNPVTFSLLFNATVSDGISKSFAQVTIRLKEHIVKINGSKEVEGSIPEGKEPNEVVPLSLLSQLSVDPSEIYFQIEPRSGDFSINNITGEVKTKVKFDRESSPVRQIGVEAVDRLNPCQKRDVFLVTISITDVNDEIPTFDDTSLQVDILENFTGPSSLNFSVNDLDIGENSIVDMTIIGPYSSMFNVTAISNVSQGRYRFNLKVVNPADYETIMDNPFDITLTATDRGRPEKLSSSATVTVSILDVNDNRPVFQPSSSPYSKLETKNGESVTIDTFSANDIDAGYNGEVSYYIDSNDQGNFFIDRISGELKASRLDYEQTTAYNLDVCAVDHGENPLTACIPITVQVLDRNDNAPVFERVLYSTTITEHSGQFLTVTKITASDEDSGENGKIQYSLDKYNYFAISSDGVITTVVDFDYENENMREVILEVIATDSSTMDQQLSSTATLLVRCMNIDDEPPVFSDSRMVSRIRTGSPAGSVVTVIEATDADTPAQDIVYSVSPDNLFTIDKGVVTVKMDGLVTTETQQTLTVTASDGKQSADATIQILILNQVTTIQLTQPPPIIEVFETSPPNSLLYNRTVNTNFPVNFAFYGPTSKFELTDSGKMFYIRNSAVLDREEVDSYTGLVVVSRDGNSNQYALINVTINVLDVNDNPPTCGQPLYQFNITENNPANQKIGSLNGTDLDLGQSGRFTYSVIGSEASSFKVLPNGDLTAIGSIDREMTPEFRIQVMLIDRGSPPLNSTCVAYLSVTDVDDTPPTFHPIQLPVRVRENTPANRSVAFIQSKDIDTKPEDIRYQLVSDWPQFQIDRNTGRLSTTSLAIDREKFSNFSLVVEASDPGGNKAYFNVSIEVDDVNDNSPIFENETYSTTLSSNETIGTMVLTVHATDRDPQFGYIVYGFQEQSTNFRINITSGEITLTHSLADISRATETITAIAIDNGNPSKTASTTVTIEIRGNSFSPYFPQQDYDAEVEEEASNAPVIHLTALDLDNGTIFTYSLLSTEPSIYAEYFQMFSSGYLYTKKALDREAMASRNHFFIQVRVQVADDGFPSFVNYTDVNVTVKDINDNVPSWRNNTITIELPQKFAANTTFPIPRAYDADLNENGRITYSLGNTNGKNLSIDKDTGEMTLLTECGGDCIKPRDYVWPTLVVFARNPSSNSLGTVLVEIKLTYNNPNKYYPRFVKGPTELSVVFEDSGAAQKIGEFEAVDDDKTGVVYDLEADARALTICSINNITGVLYMDYPPDENRNLLNLTVVAKDTSLIPKSSRLAVRVNITNGNGSSGQYLIALIVIAAVAGVLILSLAGILFWKWRQYIKTEEKLRRVRHGAYMKMDKRSGNSSKPDRSNGKAYLGLDADYLQPMSENPSGYSGIAESDVTPDFDRPQSRF